MEKENKKTNGKNVMKMIQILTIILLIVLLSIINFFGIYKQDKNQMSNLIKGYSYAMDINGVRTIKLQVNTDKKAVVKDSKGNIIDEATDEEIKQNGYIKEEIPNNSEEILIEENYNKCKAIIEKRLKTSGVEDYNISLNTKTGEITIEIPEDSRTDNVIGNLNTVGKFEIIDSETKEILLNNNNIKSSDVLYNNTSTGTSVYLEIDFNRDGKNKLEEISKTYVATNEIDETSKENTTSEENVTDDSTNITEEEATVAKAVERKIIMKIDDKEIMTTSFEEPITTGKIQLSVGTATTDSSTLQDYIAQAQSVSTVLDSGNLPINYDIKKNEYILSNITEKDLTNMAIVVAVIVAIGIIVLIIKYKTNGLLAGFSYIGLVALYMLLVRYTNVVISIESIFGIIIMLILNYILTLILLDNINRNINNKKENIINKATLETYSKFFVRIIPICIMVIAFCFVKWIPISSFGMISFWGLILIAVYNAVITRMLLKIKTENK